LTLPLVLAPEAEDDLLDAADWYDAQQPGLGDAFLRSVDASFARIGRFPRSFPANDRDIRSALLRRFPYAVLFRIRETRIEVVAIWHGRRGPEGWRERLARSGE
jgi:plasmid stabilization system protein ParE